MNSFPEKNIKGEEGAVQGAADAATGKTGERIRPRASGKASKRSMAVIAIIFIIVLGAYGASLFLLEQPSSSYAVVHASDGSEEKLPLDKDTTITVSTDLGSNTIVVSNGAVSVIDADCPNHDCIQQGAISNTNQQIVCLPHKLWIEVVAEGTANGARDAESQESATGTDSGLFDATTR